MPGDNLKASPYYTETQDSPYINQLFAALYDLVLGRGTSMSIITPTAGRSLDDIWSLKVPQAKNVPEKDAKWLVGPEIMAYLKYLVVAAPYKDPTAQPHGAELNLFYLRSLRTCRTNEKVYRRKLKEQLEIWYAKFPITKKRNSSMAFARGEDDVEEFEIAHDSEEDEPAAGAGGAPGAGAGGD